MAACSPSRSRWVGQVGNEWFCVYMYVCYVDRTDPIIIYAWLPTYTDPTNQNQATTLPPNQLQEGRSPTAFYDALDVYKGPSLGTNYTLACPYTLLVRGMCV